MKADMQEEKCVEQRETSQTDSNKKNMKQSWLPAFWQKIQNTQKNAF